MTVIVRTILGDFTRGKQPRQLLLSIGPHPQDYSSLISTRGKLQTQVMVVISPILKLQFLKPSMITIPYGESGLLLILGDNSNLRKVSAFNNHTLYDKKFQKWYSQTAFGEIPEPRSHFCAVGIIGTTNSSFEM